MTRYMFRMDDIAPNMHWVRYFQLLELFGSHDLKPLLGVIPDNQDPELRRHAHCEFDFWEHIRDRQATGWDIAVHGYQHLLGAEAPESSGPNKRTEFAGLPYSVQYDKLKQAVSIFRKQGLRADTFMAPAHSFDRTTLEALKDVGIYTITDGYALYPTWRHGILFVPQQFANPRRMPFGVYTFCLHPNSMTDTQFAMIAAFLQRNRHEVIAFSEAEKYVMPAWPQLPGEVLLRLARVLLKHGRACLPARTRRTA